MWCNSWVIGKYPLLCFISPFLLYSTVIHSIVPTPGSNLSPLFIEVSLLYASCIFYSLRKYGEGSCDLEPQMGRVCASLYGLPLVCPCLLSGSGCLGGESGQRWPPPAFWQLWSHLASSVCCCVHVPFSQCWFMFVNINNPNCASFLHLNVVFLVSATIFIV